MALTVNHPLSEVAVSAYLADSGTASSTFTVAPFRGTIVKLYSVVHAAIGTANNAVTPKINGTAVTGGTLTQLTASSAAGDVVSATPTAANLVNEGDNIEFASDGAGSNTTPSTFIAVIRRS
jgi:hypothetical protein